VTEPRLTVRHAWGSTLVFAIAAAALTVAAGLVIFSAFMFYDDEGYVLLSLRNFAEHGHLYGEVYSQYGPFPYFFYYLLNLLGGISMKNLRQAPALPVLYHLRTTLHSRQSPASET
jgi:hypothetical protein